MSESQVAIAMPLAAPSVCDGGVEHERHAPIEFVGTSDETIAEAVRRALSRASLSLHTLEGVDCLVIPQIDRRGVGARYQVTLQITSGPTSAAGQRPVIG